jgi:hypothetical protein
VCSKQYFFEYIVHREEVLAWLFHPPTSFEVAAEEALNFGIPRIREMLKAPLFKENKDGSLGEYIPMNAASVLAAMKFLDARVKGSPLQRIEQKSLHLHKHEDFPRGVSLEEMRHELDSLNAKLGGHVLQINAPVPDETE